MTEATTDGLADVARRFVARAPIYMSLMDLEGRVIQMSQTFVKAFVDSTGVSQSEVIGKHAVEALPEVGPVVNEIYERLAAGEPTIEIDRNLPLPDGRSLCLRSQASYWRDDAGAPTAIILVHQDISAEVEARRAREESEAQLRAVVDNLPAQIALMDLDSGRIELLNAGVVDSAAIFLGATVGCSFRDILRPDQVDKLLNYIERTEAAGGVIEGEHEFNTGKMTGRIARVKHIIFRDARGRRQLLWIAEDITELRESAEALQRAAAEAAAANRAKSEFLANMSHEIRTPLNGVMGVAGALAKTTLTPAQREMVSLVETSAKTLETLLSDILDLARIEAGKMELRPEPFDLATSVNACTALFDAAAQAKGLDLEMVIAPGALGAYIGDAARIRQILSNLLGNAVKFTQTGRVRLSVQAHRGETSSELRFEVSDSGIGFDEETKARLFSRFEQADGSITRRFGGSGLGLAISRSLAEAMGGRLEADATPGKGAVFTLTVELPRTVGAFDLWCEEAEGEAQQDPMLGMRVLLAEDHPTNRRVVELILGAAGVDLTCVENGADAVEAFRTGVFELILMDMQMPVMDGLTAIAQIRELERQAGSPPTPTFVLTANAMPEHVSASLQAGADGHLSKPILADALLERVAEVAGARPLAAIRAEPASLGSRSA